MKRVALIAILGVTAIIYGLSLSSDVIGEKYDDACYVSLAGFIAEGNGFHSRTLPIGFPLLLVAAWKVFPSFPRNLICLKLVSVVVALLGVAKNPGRSWRERIEAYDWMNVNTSKDAIAASRHPCFVNLYAGRKTL